MRKWRVGTLSMGILFVAAGILMIMARINGVSAIEQIVKYWPVVLIILGIEVLVYSIIKRENTEIKFDWISISIVAFVIVICFVTYGVSGLVRGIRGINIFNGSKFHSEFEKTMTVDAANMKKIVLDNAFGDVRIGRSSGSGVEILASIRIDNNDKEYAKQISEMLVDVKSNDCINITTKRSDYLDDNRKIQNISVDYEIKVPGGLSADVNNQFGSVYIENLNGSADIKNSHGSVSVKSIDGDLHVDTSFDAVRAEDISGKAEIYNKHGNVYTKGTGGLIVETSFAGVEVEDVGGDAKITDNNGNVNIKGVDGFLYVDSKFCGITADDIKGSADITGNNANMTLKAMGGDVKVRNRFGNIELSDANNKVELETNNGNIRYDSEGLVEGDVRIKNQFGDIVVNIPGNQQGKFNASTRFGSIYNDFGISINENSGEKSIDVRIGDAKAVFNLETSNGDIKISRQ